MFAVYFDLLFIKLPSFECKIWNIQTDNYHSLIETIGSTALLVLQKPSQENFKNSSLELFNSKISKCAQQNFNTSHNDSLYSEKILCKSKKTTKSHFTFS